jgi:uncharacterized protein (DUF488 family)
MKLVTIGAYGFTEAAFFNALQAAGVDTFCDLRWRRGVRGAMYVFANRVRLERRLAELGIRYQYFRELAAPPVLRQQQYAADRIEGTTKRKRLALGEAFIAGYRQQCLSTFDSRKFLEQLGPEARVVALFCVEREPAACHRSLVAEHLIQQLGPQTEVAHLRP